MSIWTWLWLSWLAMFVVIEAAALSNKKLGDTLSEHIWSWASIKSKETGYWRLRRFILLAFLAWLASHMLSGGAF